jgi:magnesium chelatase family protein
MLPPPAEGSAEVAARVAAARARQAARHAALGTPEVRTNAAASGTLIEQTATPDAAGARLLRDAAEAMRLSARAYHRVLKVARTIADLDGVDTVGRIHLAEALSYRGQGEGIARAA